MPTKNMNKATKPRWVVLDFGIRKQRPVSSSVQAR